MCNDFKDLFKLDENIFSFIEMCNDFRDLFKLDEGIFSGSLKCVMILKIV
jgi:hypothetical protein